MVDSIVSVEDTYRRYFRVIREKCRRMLGDRSEAEDVAQETFARLWRARNSIHPDPRCMTAWIYRTATRLAVDRLRARHRGTTTEPPEARDENSPEVLIAARRALRDLARQLPDDELEIAILSRIDALGQREIAEVTGRSERTVRRILRRLDERLSPLAKEPS